MSEKRIETGALQIDDDWAGLFIRGDDALHLRSLLVTIYPGVDPPEQPFIYKLIRAIDVDVDHSRPDRQPQIIKTAKGE